ncbi:MAG: hypothetical protein JWN95_2806 [Frankiales bacterium]|nr:hypothetical protein [Frankiales bacterium]
MSENNDELFGDTVYEAGDDDAEYLDPAETLTGDALTEEEQDEPLDTSYSPPDHRPSATRFGTTALEAEYGESLDQRLAEEEPDVSSLGDDDSEAEPRAGRLVAPDEGTHDDEEKDEIAIDVGRAGAASSAEEAAVHIIDPDLDPGAEHEDTIESDSVDELD